MFKGSNYKMAGIVDIKVWVFIISKINKLN